MLLCDVLRLLMMIFVLWWVRLSVYLWFRLLLVLVMIVMWLVKLMDMEKVFLVGGVFFLECKVRCVSVGLLMFGFYVLFVVVVVVGVFYGF